MDLGRKLGCFKAAAGIVSALNVQSIWASALAALAVLMGSMLMDDAALAGTPFSQARTCNYTGGPSCPETPAVPQPFYYMAEGWWVPVPQQWFPSVSDFVSWFQGKVVSPSGWCSAPYVGDSVAGSPTYQYGQLQQQDLSVEFDEYYNTGTCTNQGPSYYNYLIQTRHWYCPSPTSSIFYQSSPAEGPYCPSEPTDPAKVGPSCCGGGAGSSNSGGADGPPRLSSGTV